MLWIALIFFTFGCAFGSIITFSAHDDPTLSSKFNPQDSGWLGADVSVSIPLGNGNYMWLWGDTLIGNITQDETGHQYRNLTAFPHSSMAIVNMSGDQLPSYYFTNLPNSYDVDPMGLFRPDNPSDPEEFYWTVEGIIAPTSQQLLVIAQVIVDTNTGLGFTQMGTDVILVSNPLEPLENWNYTTSRILESNTNLTWNSGITFYEGYFYLVGLDNLNAYLARINESDMTNFNWEEMTFWSQDNVWDNDIGNLLPLFPSIYTEGTLQFHPYMQRWFLILAQAYQGSIYIAHSPSITGPYTIEPIYNFPKDYQNGTFFAYAGKSHPEFAEEQEIVFTYNVNCNSLSLLFQDLDIYHPKFVRVSIKVS